MDYPDVIGEWFGKMERIARIGIVLLMMQSIVVYDMILSDVMFGLVSGGIRIGVRNTTEDRGAKRVREGAVGMKILIIVVVVGIVATEEV